MSNKTTVLQNKSSKSVDDFAALLGIRQGHEKTSQWVQSRLAKLELGKTCDRCGGCGHYSWCQMWGSICFKCGGSGSVIQTLTDELFEKASEKVADGTNDAIWKEIALRQQAKKADKVVMDAWSAATKQNPYTWMRAVEASCDFHPLHRKAADFNKIMADAQSAVSAASRAVLSAEYALIAVTKKKGFSKEDIAAAEENIANARAVLLKQSEDALRIIAETAEAIFEWRKTLTAEELAILGQR